MASISKSGKNWRAQVVIKGIRDSKTFSTKAEAVAWSAARETEIREQKGTGIVAGKTYGDMFDRYEKEVSRTKRGYRWEATRLNAIGETIVGGRKIKDMLASESAPDFWGKWRDQRLAGTDQVKAVKGSTVNRDLNLLSHVFSTAQKEWAWLAQSPTTAVRRPKNPGGRDRRPSQDEIDRLCMAMGFDEAMATTKTQRAAIAFLFAIETAMRAGEICALRPVDVAGRVARLPMTKNGTKRDVPLSTRAVELLKLLPAVDDDKPMFDLTAASLDALFRKAKTAAMVDGLTFHDSRHEAITRLAKKLNVLELARMVGHRDLRMLQIYYNETAEEIANKLS